MCVSPVVLGLSLFSIACAAESFNCKNDAISDTIRSAYLNYHNEARRRVAKGIEPNKAGTLNPASNMYKMSWSCEMEMKAQEYVKNCNANLGNLGPYAGNIANFGGSIKPNEAAPMVLKMWWSKGQQVGLPSDNVYNNQALYTFGNMVQAKATEIGCAQQTCGSATQVLCLYNAIGYITGQKLYETGAACTGCPSMQCDDGLCVKAPVGPTPVEDKICKGTSMNDEIRQKILDEHNKLRSQTARGLSKDKLGGTAPKAAAMYKLQYDCDLEKFAISHASKCVYGHSAQDSRKNIGENIFSIGLPGAERAWAGELAVASWFEELEKYGVGQDNVFNDKLINRNNTMIGHYTQVVWGDTKYIGCAVQNCASMTLVACNYKIAGNFKNNLIYEKGEPCSKCPAGDMCASTAEKLCLKH